MAGIGSCLRVRRRQIVRFVQGRWAAMYSAQMISGLRLELRAFQVREFASA